MKFNTGDRVRFNNPGYIEWHGREGTVTGQFNNSTVFVKLDGKFNPVGDSKPGHEGDYAFRETNLTLIGPSLE